MKNIFSRLTGSKNNSQGQSTTNNVVSSPSYTEEFPYLPSYHWVQANEYFPATADEPLVKAKYIIHNSKDAVVFDAYKAILEKDGWTITEETPVINFVAQKDNHIATISFSIFGDDVLMTVLSK
ncbi:hypothetical protein REC12_09730 [Desulfosporosinus sp. PR]|uniref:hypothetical protein n=1 Tax=Candidatus Desulfosporosinus nitrosoreducens TaxID=3401928 RepID=UPI0027ECA79F|nr:hypothetical protein [Desulfosporosinus sp. PR]MDQ7093872.1 hypothetical protein [Desulfosporosinus sp. PR]